MSLLINPNKVTHVLLADGWHEVEDFTIDAYEFAVPIEREGWTDHRTIHGDGAGFSFIEPGGTSVAGPMSSLLAVREKVK